MPSQDGKTVVRDDDNREDHWLLGAICFVTVAGVVGLILTLYSPHGGDAAILAVMAGFVGAAMAGLVAALKGARILRRMNEEEVKIDRIDHAVNGNMDAKFSAQERQIRELRELVEKSMEDR